MSTTPRILVTGATGQLGRLVIDALLPRIPASHVIAGARTTGKAADLAKKGIEVRELDYAKPATLTSALSGVTKLLLISSSEVGQRVTQHQQVIAAAQAAGVELIGYTSILRGAGSIMTLAHEHIATEAALAQSGLPYVILRNGWYLENYASLVGPALEHGKVLGASGAGRIAAAARRDYAEATAVVLASAENQGGRLYELAGDAGFTMAEWAQTVSELSGKKVVYENLSKSDYTAALQKAGLPTHYAEAIADSSAAAALGALDDRSRALSTLIKRPTTTLRDSLAAALKH